MEGASSRLTTVLAGWEDDPKPSDTDVVAEAVAEDEATNVHEDAYNLRLAEHFRPFNGRSGRAGHRRELRDPNNWLLVAFVVAIVIGTFALLLLPSAPL
jgi:hypothetical protein